MVTDGLVQSFLQVTDDAVLVRDTKDRSLLAHRFTHGEWAAFVAGVRNGEFDL